MVVFTKHAEVLFHDIWGWVKTLVPSEPQNSWDLWMFIPLKMLLIGIDPYPFDSKSGCELKPTKNGMLNCD